MNKSTIESDLAEPLYSPAEYAQFAQLRHDLKQEGQQRRRETPDVAAAVQLAPLLRQARSYLATFRPRVCSSCGHVFSPSGRVDGRCLDCAPRQLAHGIQPLPSGGD